MPRPFLTARWVNLCIFSWPVPPERLQPRLAPGLTLDSRHDSAWVSLVAFDFQDTRVKGIRWPGYVRFPEVNLRFYVRHGDQRGVMFVREYVPRRMISTIARLRYNEPYATAPMTGSAQVTDDELDVDYTIRIGGRTHRIGAIADARAHTPPDDSDEHWFKEHSWGYGVTRRTNRLLHYRVDHPVWQVHPIREIRLDVDWAALYGNEWADMNELPPKSTVLAAGSEISVSPVAR